MMTFFKAYTLATALNNLHFKASEMQVSHKRTAKLQHKAAVFGWNRIMQTRPLNEVDNFHFKSNTSNVATCGLLMCGNANFSVFFSCWVWDLKEKAIWRRHFWLWELAPTERKCKIIQIMLKLSSVKDNIGGGEYITLDKIKASAQDNKSDWLLWNRLICWPED